MHMCGRAQIHTHTHTHIYIYIYMPWIRKCVTKKTGCGIRHKCTKYTEFLQSKIL